MNDEEWHKNVEEHLLRDLVEDCQERLKDHDVILNGERGKTGLIAEYDRHDEKLTRLYAVIFQDSTGQKGLLHDVDSLMGRKSNREKTSERKWDFWKSILVAMIMSGAMTTLINQWPAIKKMFPKPGPLEQKIEQARHPKSKKKIFRYRVVSETPPGTDQNTRDPEKAESQ